MLEHDRPATAEVVTPHRPLPVVPRLHDDVPVGRALHAPGRPRPRAHRANLPASVARPADAAVPRSRHAVSAQAARGDDGGRARQAVRAAAGGDRIEAARRGGKARAAPRARRDDRARRLSGERAAQRSASVAGGAARRLRQRGAVAVDHRGHDPPAQPPRRRGCGRGRRGLLRLARASPRPGGGRVREGARQHRRLDPRARRRRARRHPRHHLGLRHDREGLRLHAAHRPGLCGAGGQGFEPGARHLGISGRARTLAASEALQSHRRVPLRLLIAARPARPSRAPGPADGLRLRGERNPRSASVLRLGRHLQYPAAGHRRAAARPQDRQHCQDWS